MIEDWEKWMEEHHIRIGGKTDDNRTDEVKTGRSVSGSKVETEMPDDAGSTGGSHIQKSN